MNGDPNCPKCHGSGWDGEGYTLCCSGCRPSLGDLWVDERCGRHRDKNGVLIDAKTGESITNVKISEAAGRKETWLTKILGCIMGGR